MQKHNHIVVNIKALPFKVDRFCSLPQQVLGYYEKDGWELCAVDDIFYFFKRPL